MKFKDTLEKIITSDLYNDLFHGGYIDPEQMLEDEELAQEVIRAMILIESFINNAINAEVIEVI